ncbi:TusE/DsrC/DsvC family sulfur relay protein [Buchnera aphidicola]|uniref:TusE/DsrC/DsvC family sulfur relay protein n=1 Tax=Buchnera aphidicola TaxID=9 RepID=UPI003463853C
MNNKKKWNKNTAIKIAKKESIILTSEHWEIIYLLRECYKKFKIIPKNRVLLQLIKEKTMIKDINNRYLLKLFPKGIMKQANKIAGLPKSNICL